MNNKYQKNNVVYENDISQKSSSIKIIELVKIIWNINSSFIEIKQLKNGFYLSYGIDKLIIFDTNLKYKYEINNLDDTIYYISEIDSDNLENEIYLGIITIKTFFLVKINIESGFNKIENLNYDGIFFLQVSNKSFILSQASVTYFYTDIFDKICKQFENILTHEPVFNGLFLNKTKNLCVLTSNEILPYTEDDLIFYDISQKQIYKNIAGSFTLSLNGIALLESQNSKEPKILLLGSKRYKKAQKNGILISVSLFKTKDDNISSIFYSTENFEVYCFCQILLNREKKGWNRSNYFFVGGFNNDTRQGLIKLYKAYFNEVLNKSKIEFIDDIIIENLKKQNIQIFRKKSIEEILNTNIFSRNAKNKEFEKIQVKQNFKGFRGPITSIIQNNFNGNILISCYDGNIYLFTPPNLDYYLSNEINC